MERTLKKRAGAAAALLIAAAVLAAAVAASRAADAGPPDMAGAPTAVLDPERGPSGPGTDVLLPELASASRALELPGGWPARWAVLDRRSERVHLLDARLTPVWSTGAAGDGPGELRAPLLLALSGDTLLAVLAAVGGRLDLFAPDGAFVRRVVLRDACRGLSSALLDAAGGDFLIAGACASAGGLSWRVRRAGADGAVHELLDAPPPEGFAEVFPPSLVLWRAAPHVVRADGCLRRLEGKRETAEGLCLPAAPRRALPDSLRSLLLAPTAGRPLPTALEVVVPTHVPRVLTAYATAAGPVLVEPTAGSGGTRALLLDGEGRVTPLPAQGLVGVGRSALLYAEALPEGTRLRSVPWSP